MPYGPKDVSELTADANYLRSAVGNIRYLQERPNTRSPWGSNLTDTICKLLLDAADSLEAVQATVKADRLDYLPGWDDRKDLMELWQEHAKLPEGDLRADGIFQAMIAVAVHGYRARQEEEL